MRFPVVLFDLDGTLIDSGPIILASMKHASLAVLGREPDEELVRSAIGGPGLIAQMRDLDPDRVDELAEAYRVHNEPLHAERHKPEPDPVLEALRRLAADSGDAVYVGDSPYDITAGNAAGVFTIAVGWGGIHPDERLLHAGPDALVRSAEELRAAL